MKTFILLLISLCCYGALLNQASAQSLEANKALARKYLEEAVNQRRLELLDEIFLKTRISHSLNDGTSTRNTGTEKLKTFLEYLFNAFPDLQYTISHVMAEGDKVVVRAIFTGTQVNEFWGVPASNKKIDYLSEIFFFRIEDGKIVESWVQLDLHTLFKKLKGE